MAYLSEFYSGKFKKKLRFYAVDVISDSSEISDIITDILYDDTLIYRRAIEFPNEYFEVDSNAFYRFCFYTSNEEIEISPFGISFSMDKNGKILSHSNFSKHNFLNKDDKIIPIYKVHEEIEKRNITPETVRIYLSYNEKKKHFVLVCKQNISLYGH